jgi:hypothetical protein
MQVYLDESGDLGWNFAQPFNQGGSSRYLALAFLFAPDHLRRKTQDIITSFYRHYKWTGEKKCSKATINQKVRFCEETADLLKKHTDIKVDTIVVNKINVNDHIREDGNKLYNYMCGLVVPSYVSSEKTVDFIPDKRSVKVRSGNSLCDYLQVKLWFDTQCSTRILDKSAESHSNHNIQFVDWIAHCVWMHFEFGTSKPFDILSPHIRIRKLYF